MIEMKDSGVNWIGEIPSSWKTRRIKEFLSERKEVCTSEDSYDLLAVSEYYGVAKKADVITADEFLTHAESLDGYKICYPDDLVMNIMLAWKRAMGVSQYAGITSPAYCVFYAKENVIMRYFHYLFRTDFYASLFKQFSTGIIDSRLRLYPDKFLALSCHFPTISEQQRIADFLDRKCADIDNVLKKTRASIEKYKKLKQSVITEAVTKGIRGNRQMKDSGIEWIEEIPKEWIVIKLKHLALISRGLFNHRPRNDERLYIDGTYPFIQTGDISGANKFITSYTQTLNEYGIAVSKLFHKGTLTMSIAANVGDVSILGFDAYFPDSVLGLEPKSNCETCYLFYLLKAFKEELVNTSSHNTQLNLNIDRVGNIKVPYANSIIERNSIVAYLDQKCSEIDSLIESKESFITELEAYRKSLIYEYVTGKREVIS